MRNKEGVKVNNSSFILPNNLTYEFFPHRGLIKETLEKYQTKVGILPDGTPACVVFPFSNGARKIRGFAEKTFRVEGPISEAKLFGEELFAPGSAKAVTVTEGLHDAPSAYQMLGSKYPSVSLKNGASGAKKDCLRSRDFLNSFDKIYLNFDEDDPGQKAVRAVADLFDYNKVHHVRLPHGVKDANDFLQSEHSKTFQNVWWNAKRFLPEGVVSTFAEFDSIIDNAVERQGVPLHLPTLQEKTGGLRTNEATLITGLEGVGKTELIRTFEHTILKDTDFNIGVIHLEEPKHDVIRGYAGYELKAPVRINPGVASNDEVKAAYRRLVRRDERLHVYAHFGSDDPDVILDTIRFLVSGVGCKYIFLDHITMVVSGLADEDERRALDKICTRLAMMLQELDFGLIFVSHINDLGQTRGSRYISKIAHTWIELSRDLTADSEYLRGVMNVMIKKNRPKSQTGPAGKLFLSPDDQMYHELREEELPV